MSWLDEVLEAVRRDDPIPCGGCGRPWKRADMLEAWFPDVAVEMAPGLTITPLTLHWVGPCCASMAADWQPGQPP